MTNNVPAFENLSLEDQLRLKKIKTIDDLKEVTFIRTWMQDGLPSAAMSINGIEVAFENLDTDMAASFMNPGFTDAKTSILKRLKSKILLMECAVELDDEDEFEQEDVYVDNDSYGSAADGDWGGGY